ncbi:hypothetical protein AVEN_123005-1 [Araneus ventricosus]|uniref:Uncharacterized protein n=1 Tax=Araneus ventricosus TaxID=182803 RepID=A0A4Y2CXR7_ARAVE|nr:hypothetical protein AVEN_123005-1 [Araneus ventricosus]
MNRITEEKVDEARYLLTTHFGENWATLPELKWFQDVKDGSSEGDILNEDFEKCNCLDKDCEQEMGIKTITFTDISGKSPDVSPMEFCDFGLSKIPLSKRRPTTLCGLWKDVQEEWDKIPLPIPQQ